MLSGLADTEACWAGEGLNVVEAARAKEGNRAAVTLG